MAYNRTTLKANIATLISGTVNNSDLNTIVNRAVRDVISEHDLRSCIRKSALSPNLFDEVYQYSAPADLKGDKIIDVKPQTGRSKNDYWRKTTAEEFDRRKQYGRNDSFGDPIKLVGSNWNGESLVATQDTDMVKKVLLSKAIDDTAITLDPLTTVGTWTAFGDGTNLTADYTNYIKGSSSINWDINADGGTTAGIENSALTSVDISNYITEGVVLVWVYLSSKTNVTNLIFRIGSSSSAYNTITATTNNEGTAFVNGWNLIRFNYSDKTVVGTPTNSACTYSALYMTKTTGKISETDYRFNYLTMRQGAHYDLVYYSKYGWQNLAGAYIENSTLDTDFVNADTDEIRLIEERAALLGEMHIRSSESTIKAKKNSYLEASALYKMQYPSTVLLLTTTYNDMDYGNSIYY